MIVTSVPWRLRFAVSSLFFSVLWIALEVIIVNRSGWWNLPWLAMGYWAFSFLLICVPLVTWLLGANRWAYYLTLVLSVTWVLVSGVLAYRMTSTAMGFFVLSLGAYLFGILSWLRFELSRSFFNPQVTWYQGLPKPIPGLKCKLVAGSQSTEVRVSYMDREGVFVFSSDILKNFSLSLNQFLSQKKPRKNLELVFQYRDSKMSCEGTPTLLMERGAGVGIRFRNLSPDLQKEIGDFIERLRGEGYV
jgi:hypothetical protein